MKLQAGVCHDMTHAPTQAVGRAVDRRSIERYGSKRRHAMLGAKVFTATKAKDREELGEVLTRWLRDNPRAKVLDKVVTQSSDREFHCLSITLFYELTPA